VLKPLGGGDRIEHFLGRGINSNAMKDVWHGPSTIPPRHNNLASRVLHLLHGFFATLAHFVGCQVLLVCGN
jgi:hypothetical protein